MKDDRSTVTGDNTGASNGGNSKGMGDVAKEAKTTAKDLGREARQQARSTAEYLREQANGSLHDGKDQVAKQVEGLATAFRKSGEELRNQELGRLADGSEWVAGRVEELQHYLRDREPGDMLNDLRSVAHRQPAWFLGGMFVAGLMAARFVQSGSDRHSSDHGRQGSHQEPARSAETATT